jgi:RHS repeat-associated protein
LGHVTTYSYDALNRQMGETEAVGTPVQRTTNTVYDADGNITETIDALGRITTYSYDALNRQTGETEAVGTPVQRTTTTVYDADDNVIETIDALGRVTTYSYDALNRWTGQTEAVGTPVQRTMTTVYDADNNVTETIDALGQATIDTYDALNRRVSVTDPLGLTTTTVYDADDNIIATTDPRGFTTTHVYDALNRWIETIDALNEITVTVYDADDNVIETIDPRGNATTDDFDALNRRVSVTDPLGRTTTTVYDADDNLIATIDPLGFRTTSAYDALNRRTSVQQPNGGITTTVYDADDNVLATIDPMGNTTSYEYDALNRRVEMIDARGGIATYLYDAADNQTGVIDPDNNRTTFIYDALNRKVETIDPPTLAVPQGAVTTYVYDALDRLISTTDALGRVTTFAYDADGRLVGKTWHDSGGAVSDVFTYTYDADGDQLTATDSSGTYTMTYDAMDRLSSSEDLFGLTRTYAYDANGNRIETRDSLGGVTTYVYDADDELVSEQFGGTGQVPLRIDLSYDGRGELLTETRSSDLAETKVVVESFYTYDADSNVTNLLDRNGAGTMVANFTYTYDRDDRVTTVDNLGMTTTYAYDADSETSRLARIDYTYDPNGNRIGGNNVVGPDNQLLSDGTWDYTYDADGNLIEKVGLAHGPDHGITWTYTYNNRNQMTTAVGVQNGTTLASVTYVYDALGDRIEEDVTGSNLASQVTRFADDGQDVWADLDGNDHLVVRRLFLDAVDSVTARITASGTAAWYLGDRLGSVNVLTDSTGTVIDRITYDGYGNILSESNPAASDRYLWTGREFDRMTGLQYNRARYYDPTTGRWTSEDPLGLGPDSNPYRYVGNTSTNMSDPQGLEPPANADAYRRFTDELLLEPQASKQNEATSSGLRLRPSGVFSTIQCHQQQPPYTRSSYELSLPNPGVTFADVLRAREEARQVQREREEAYRKYYEKYEAKYTQMARDFAEVVRRARSEDELQALTDRFKEWVLRELPPPDSGYVQWRRVRQREIEESQRRQPSVRAVTPAEKEAMAQRDKANKEAMAERERQILHLRFIELSFEPLRTAGGAPVNFDIIRQGDEILWREEAERRAALSETERIVEFMFEQLIWALATAGVGEFAMLGVRAPRSVPNEINFGKAGRVVPNGISVAEEEALSFSKARAIEIRDRLRLDFRTFYRSRR